MTLIAMATYGDHAEFVTDTTSYTLRLERLGTTTKHLTLNHLDAAFLTAGDSGFADQAKSVALQLGGSMECEGFDWLVEAMAANLPEVQEVSQRFQERDDLGWCSAFLIGWSPSAQEFLAYAFLSEHHFEPVQLEQPFAMPSPHCYRPMPFEMARILHDHLVDSPKAADSPEFINLLEQWREMPAMPTPVTDHDWIDLAIQARRHRSLNWWGKVIVHGDLIHTRLSRGEVRTRNIHTFDTGDEFTRMVTNTQHPAGLTQPCGCGSGTAFGDCHGDRREP